jgi:hypothetical protein
MKGLDSMIVEDSQNRPGRRLLHQKCASWIQIGLCRKIKIHIFHIQMRNEGFAVPERSANIAPLLQAVEKLAGTSWRPDRVTEAIGRNEFTSRLGGRLAAKELQNPRSNGRISVIVPEGFKDFLHNNWKAFSCVPTRGTHEEAAPVFLVHRNFQ